MVGLENVPGVKYSSKSIYNSKRFADAVSVANLSYFSDLVRDEKVDVPLRTACTKLAKAFREAAPKKTQKGFSLPLSPDFYAGIASALSSAYHTNAFNPELLAKKMHRFAKDLNKCRENEYWLSAALWDLDYTLQETSSAKPFQ